jgi:hypothetical protein
VPFIVMSKEELRSRVDTLREALALHDARTPEA